MSELGIGERPVELLQRLIRFDTTNPPGRERECIEWVQRLLEASGCGVQIVARDPDRPNLVARLPGDGRAPGLLLVARSMIDAIAAELPAPFAVPVRALLRPRLRTASSTASGIARRSSIRSSTTPQARRSCGEGMP